MRRQGQKTLLGVMAWLIAGVFLFYSSSVFAVSIAAIQYTLYSSDAFYVDGGNGRLFLDEDRTWDSDVVGNILLEGDSQYNYEIRTGSINLTYSSLLEDQSYYFDPFFNPKIAQGLFEKGATLTITGSITTVGGGEVLFENGTLIEATITDNFYGVEQMWTPDFLDLQMNFNLTGGELFTGAETGFVLSSGFITDVTLRWCTQFGHSELDDFSSDIGYAQPSVVQINPDAPVPEPASLVIFGLAGLLMKKSKTNN